MPSARRTYFAYGSNMLIERLRHRSRCPSAIVVGRAEAPDHTVAFHKRSNKDQSGKATLRPHPGNTAHGVLYELDAAALAVLDRVEGVGFGYERMDDFTVVHRGAERLAVTYVATESHLVPDLVPFDWYHALVVAGARQHNLPAEYLAHLTNIETGHDADPLREAKREALDALIAAGFADLADRLR